MKGMQRSKSIVEFQQLMRPDAQAGFDRSWTDSSKLTDGNMKNLAFIQDPDGYMIEILSNSVPAKF